MTERKEPIVGPVEPEDIEPGSGLAKFFREFDEEDDRSKPASPPAEAGSPP